MQFDRDITINLTKVGPKLWSYNNGEARRVELAVLDYFRAQGFRGYFSEQEDYFSKLIVLCAWPIRRPWPRWLSGWEPLIRYCSDGLLKNISHNKSYMDIRDSVLNFPSDQMEETIKKFIELELKDAVWFGKRRTSADLNLDDMLSFYHAVGNTGLVEYLDQRLSKERFDAKNYLSTQLRITGVEDYLRQNFKSDRINLINYAFFMGVDNWRNSYEIIYSKVLPNMTNPVLAVDLDKIAEFAYEQRKITEAKRSSEAILDLTMWDRHGAAYAEVKAPKDRLQSHQEQWIATLRANGTRATTVWVNQT